MKINRILFLFAGLSLLLAACQSKPQATPAPTNVATSRSTVAEGRLAPRTSADLAFSTGGRVAEVLVVEGDSVLMGQVLARLELPNAEMRQSELARAEQEALLARQALDTLKDPSAAAQRITQARFDLASLAQQADALQEELNDENDRSDPDELIVARLEAQIALLDAQSASTQALLDKIGAAGIDPAALEAAETRLLTANAAVAAAEAALQPVELVAPWDGVLASLDLVAGQSVTAGLPVATLADFSAWVVRTDNLTEIEVVGLQPGQTVNLSLDALPEVELTGTIESIRPKSEEKRGDVTYTVTIVIDTLDSQARWGMTASVKLDR